MTSPTLPKRQSLIAMTRGFVHDQIAAGEWRNWLPSERSLCQLLQVSRNTLRSALTQLAKENIIQPIQGQGNKIITRPLKAKIPPRTGHVALLAPEPIERLRSMQSHWIDDMRGLLSERGIRLRTFHGHQYFGPRSGAALKKLVARNPHGCWIVMFAGNTVQRWFSQQRIPCVVAGSTYPDVDLPSRDLDHRAMCRHAAGVLLGLGHRQLAMLTLKSGRAGDLESEAGFMESVQRSSHAGADATVIHHEESVAGVEAAVRRLLKMKPRPTGLLVVHPQFYLATVSRIARSGLRIPEDISVISRDDDLFLSYIVPVPARYQIAPHRLARGILRPVLELLEGDTVSQKSVRIIPKFVHGQSTARMDA